MGVEFYTLLGCEKVSFPLTSQRHSSLILILLPFPLSTLQYTLENLSLSYFSQKLQQLNNNSYWGELGVGRYDRVLVRWGKTITLLWDVTF